MDFSGFSADALLEIEKIRHTEIIRKKAEDDRRRLEQQQKEKNIEKKSDRRRQTPAWKTSKRFSLGILSFMSNIEFSQISINLT